MQAKLVVCLIMLAGWCRSEAVLNGYPVTFNLAGATRFTPDAGGAAQSGYVINLGYSGASWIAA